MAAGPDAGLAPAFHYHSRALQNERAIWIRRPRSATAARHLVLFLDAEWYLDKIEALSSIRQLEGHAPEAWHVFVSMHSAEARWRECPCYRPFAEFIVEELLSELSRRFSELGSVTQRTIVGVSYTGLAAAYAAQQFPGAFAAVISQSGSFWWDDRRLVNQFAALTQPLPTRFYLTVGTREVQHNLKHREDVFQAISQIEAVRRFRDVLRARGHDVVYAEGNGAHDFCAWKESLPAALAWALTCS